MTDIVMAESSGPPPDYVGRPPAEKPVPQEQSFPDWLTPRNAAEILGALAVVAGLAMMWLPLGMLALGAALVAAAEFWHP